ncbi:MAG: prepilin peptidase [Candidatus Doudnabacteria bacterium]
MTLLFIFIFGLIVGSFLNVVIFRLASGESFLFARSHCRSCKKELQAKDLIPVFSFLYLRGRCRYCAAAISRQYPVVELATGLIFVLFALKFQMVFSWVFALNIIFACFLLVIAVYDFNHYLILDKVLLPGLVLVLLYNILQGWPVFWAGLLSGAGFAGFFLAQYLISRGKWIGLGDVKLGFVLGNLAGWPMSILVLILAYGSGAVVGIALILMGRKKFGSKLPFGIFLSLSAIIVMLAGNPIMTWYLRLIGL